MTMENVIDLSAPGNQQGYHCWGCLGALSGRALFCTHCGSIQPVRESDHFQRLGLEKRIDIDMEAMSRNYAQWQRTFSPERFVIRSHTEQTYAAKHLEAIRAAYETLHDPIRRSRYWLELQNPKEAGMAENVLLPIVNELKSEFESAREAAQLDKLAHRTGQEIEFGIMKLLSSLRGQAWKEANEILASLDTMEVLMKDLREKRQSMTHHGGAHK